MPTPEPLRLAVALDGAGWHSAAWREESSRPRELLLAPLTTTIGLLATVTSAGAPALKCTESIGWPSQKCLVGGAPGDTYVNRPIVTGREAPTCVQRAWVSPPTDGSRSAAR